MENYPETHNSSDELKICSRCKIEPALPGYPNPFCTECRDTFINYPIPKWIYAFGGGILVVMCVAMVRVPQYLEMAANLGKAQKAIKEHKYITAEKKLEKVLALAPNLTDAKAYMLIAASYNMHFDVAKKMYLDLNGTTEKIDENIKREAEDAIRFVGSIAYVDTSMPERISLAAKDSIPGLLRLYHQVDTSSSETKALSEYMVCDKLYDLKDYTDCQKILMGILNTDPQNYAALQLMSAVYRRLKEFDVALNTVNKILEINREDVGAFFQLARIELVRQNFAKAAEYAQKIASIDPKNIYILEINFIIAHSSGKKDEASRLLSQIKMQDTGSNPTVYNRTLAVSNGTETYN